MNILFGPGRSVGFEKLAGVRETPYARGAHRLYGSN